MSKASAAAAILTLAIVASCGQPARASPRLNVIIHGDSVAVGGGSSSASKTYAAQLAGLLEPGSQVQAVGRSGLPLNDALALFDRAVAPHRDPQAINIVVVHAGDNDVNAGADSANLSSALKRYVALAHARGWKVITTTELKRVDFTPPRQQILTDYDDAVRRNDFYADAVVDFGADDRLRHVSERDDRQYFIPDRIHPSDAGYGLLAEMTAKAVAQAVNRRR